FRLGLSQAHTPDLRLAVGTAGDAVLVDGIRRPASNASHSHDAGHGAGVRELRHTCHDIADGVDSLLARLHPLVHMHESALDLDLRCLPKPDLFGIWPTANRYQDFFRFQPLLLFAFGRESNSHTVFGPLHFLNLGADKTADTFLLETAQQFFRNFFVLHRHQPRQHFYQRHFGAERTVNRRKLHAHGAAADDDHGLGDRIEAQHFNVGQDTVVGFEAGQHAGERPRGQDDVFGLDLGFFAAFAFDFHREHAAFGRASQPPKTGNAVHFVLTHQKIQALGMLGHDLVLALLHHFPVQLASAQTLDAVLRSSFQMIADFGVEQQRLGRNAAYLQARPTQLGVFLEQAGFQAQLAGAERSSVPAGAGPDDGNVIDGFWQSSAPCGENRPKANI